MLFWGAESTYTNLLALQIFDCLGIPVASVNKCTWMKDLLLICACMDMVPHNFKTTNEDVLSLFIPFGGGENK